MRVARTQPARSEVLRQSWAALEGGFELRPVVAARARSCEARHQFEWNEACTTPQGRLTANTCSQPSQTTTARAMCDISVSTSLSLLIWTSGNLRTVSANGVEFEDYIAENLQTHLVLELEMCRGNS